MTQNDIIHAPQLKDMDHELILDHMTLHDGWVRSKPERSLVRTSLNLAAMREDVEKVIGRVATLKWVWDDNAGPDEPLYRRHFIFKTREECDMVRLLWL